MPVTGRFHASNADTIRTRTWALPDRLGAALRPVCIPQMIERPSRPLTSSHIPVVRGEPHTT
jgi:hypothetical protein